MLMVLSPSKTLDMTPLDPPVPSQEPRFLEQAAELAGILRTYSVPGLQALMDISEKLAQLNHDRFGAFTVPFPDGLAKPAIYAFKGDVYEPMAIASYDAADLRFAEKHLRILSGLYGLLRPLDRMLAYRLEMGTALPNSQGRNLYDFWGKQITGLLNDDLKASGSTLLVNLASQEYFKAVNPAYLAGKTLNVHFKEQRGGEEPKIVALYAKLARGMMADFVIRHRIETEEGLKTFDAGNYRYAPHLSDRGEMTFIRRH